MRWRALAWAAGIAAFLGAVFPTAGVAHATAPAPSAVSAAAERNNGTTEQPAAVDGGKREMPAASSDAAATSPAKSATAQAAPEADAEEGAETAAPACDPTPADATSYERPEMVPSPFRAWTLRLADLGVFCVLLAVGAWAVLARRRRVWFFGLLLVSAAYLGFFRHGCVCSVGAIGNVAHAVTLELKGAPKQSPAGAPAAARLKVGANGILEQQAPPEEGAPPPPPCRGGVLSVEAVLFFVLPLLLALAFGRVFCGTTCPLGALQHFLARRSLRVPRLLDRVLRVGPWLMLGWALVSAWVWLGLPICRLDPFIPLFRLAERSPAVWAFTGAVLLLCVLVARPYCRWMCPYGVLLNLVSRLALRPRRLDPALCIRCGRCAKVCPVAAIEIPPSGAPEKPVLDAAACIQCGRCNRACGKHAIR